MEEAGDFLSALDVTRAEARAGFGDDTVYLERFVRQARHVEVQILADGERAVHLGDRDCSMQRRSQKVLEEAPAPHLPDHVRQTIAETSVALAEQCGYSSAGTVEFLYDPQREEAAFIEMNTRLQVEHPVTEEITGIDIVAQQLMIASGEPLSMVQSDVALTGHAFEVRINAEDPSNGFFPSPGEISALKWPAGETIRVDTGVEEGDMVAPFYDSMVAKLIVSGADRDKALSRLSQALDETEIGGITTTLDMHRLLASHQALSEAAHHTKFIENSGLLNELEKA
ncbi:hypothetical protein [Nesterenkonia pannonica]|uniref:ATP-binding protein n=1 Tax=Nesterenkonia pannonica TaxID=1548602 RepID=UPI002164C1A1|nr:hypothetical protein [Nesterenkonia pannonica]